MDKNYDELVQRLRGTMLDRDNFPRMVSEKWLPVGLAQDGADAIVQLQADLAAALARLDSVAERDRLAIAAVEGVQQMRQDLAAARAESDLAHWLLRNARKYMNPMHEALCAAIDNVLQKKQAALAGKDAT